MRSQWVTHDRPQLAGAGLPVFCVDGNVWPARLTESSADQPLPNEAKRVSPHHGATAEGTAPLFWAIAKEAFGPTFDSGRLYSCVGRALLVPVAALHLFRRRQ